MITERTLKRWRREALMPTDFMDLTHPHTIIHFENIEMKERILRLTQELMDLQLMKKGK